MMHRLGDRLRWASKRVHDAVVKAKQTILGVGGLGSLTAAAWQVSLGVGLAALGVSLLVLQFLSEGEEK